MSNLQSIRVLVIRRAYSDIPERIVRLRKGQSAESVITKLYPEAHTIEIDGFICDGDSYYADLMHTDSV